MFCCCRSLTTLDVSSFDTANVKDMHEMFGECNSLIALDLSNFSTSKVDNMEGMFAECSNLTTLDVSNFDTANVKNMWHMFYNCPNLTTIKGVIDMKSSYTDDNYEGMFENCHKLKGVKIKNPPADFESKTGLSSSQYIVVNE